MRVGQKEGKEAFTCGGWVDSRLQKNAKLLGKLELKRCDE